MTEKKRYQVFVSSTFKGLAEERSIIKKALLEMDCIPSAMEEFPAIDIKQFEYIKNQLDDCDYYILVLGGFVGTITEDAPKGYTYKEYEYALEKGIPILAIIRKEAGDNACYEKGKNKKIYNEFIKDVESSRLCRYFEDKYELSGIVHYSLRKQMEIYPRTGWTRYERYERFEEDLILRGNVYEEFHIGNEISCIEQQTFCFVCKNTAGYEFKIHYGRARQTGVNVILVYGSNAYDLAKDIETEFYDDENVLIENIKLQISIVQFINSEKMLFFTYGVLEDDIRTYAYYFDEHGLRKMNTCIKSQTYQIVGDMCIDAPYGSQGLYDTYVYCDNEIIPLDK